MKVIQVQFAVGGKSYQVVGVANTPDECIAALKAQAGDVAIDSPSPEVLWDSETGFTYSPIAPLVTCAKDGADAGWLAALLAGRV